jgi:hypothetical protein
MSTSELERRLGEVLRQHAEDAMNQTDTQGQLETFRKGLGADTRQRRRMAWATGAVAVAASIAVAVLVVTTRSEPPDTGTPARPPSTFGPADVATEFMHLYAGHDIRRAVAFLAEDGTVEAWGPPEGPDGIMRDARWSQAVNLKITPGACDESGTTAAGTQVVCPFDYHALGSDELGRGPFSGNVFDFTVRDGQIVTADMKLAFETNGFSVQMWEPFGAWVAENHPEDAAKMYADWPDQTTQALDDQSTRLWAKHVDGYIDAVQRGETD